MKKALHIKNLSKNYKNKEGQKTISALKDVSFSVEKGSMLAFLGPNGAGKSTLINILAGIVNKSSGKILINGNDIDKEERAAKLSIGVVPQEIVIDPYFTPKETLDFQSGYYGVKKKDRITDELLNKLKLNDKSDAYVRQLSGGMKRRLMIAKAMVHSPPILILDEPTAGVDVTLRDLLWENIKELNLRGTTILITTHYLEEAESLCEDVAIIDKGNIVLNGNISSLVKNIDHKKMFITASNPLKKLPQNLIQYGFKLLNNLTLEIAYSPSKYSAAELIEKVNLSSITIKDVATKEPTLEDLFKKITE
tara:strand:+ start:364 stop:1287 length:924 start_codon:yes stop_codon:yes gene_type:complete